METICHFFRTNYILANCENAILKKSSSLNLSHYQMSELPEIIEHCATLIKLQLNQNILTKVPPGLGNLWRLQELTLDYNKLDEFPVCICQLADLKFLNVSCNSIASLPPELGNLTKLEIFWCNHTGLETIPVEIGKCKRLLTLGVRGNRLQRLPDEIGNLSELLWFTAENNELADVPQTFGLMKSLVHLNLKGNELTHFPRMIFILSNLKFVFLNENHIKDTIYCVEIRRLRDLRMLNLSKNPCGTMPEMQALAKLQTNLYVDVLTENLQDSDSIPINGPNPQLFEQRNFDPLEVEYSSDWANSVRTSQLDSSPESSLENPIEDVGNILPQLSRYCATN